MLLCVAESLLWYKLLLLLDFVLARVEVGVVFFTALTAVAAVTPALTVVGAVLLVTLLLEVVGLHNFQK